MRARQHHLIRDIVRLVRQRMPIPHRLRLRYDARRHYPNRESIPQLHSLGVRVLRHWKGWCASIFFRETSFVGPGQSAKLFRNT